MKLFQWRSLGHFCEIFLVLQIVLLALYVHVSWIGLHHVPPSADAAYHMAQDATFRSVLRAPGPLAEKTLALATWPGLYPPGVYAWTSLWPPPDRMGSDPALASFAVFIVILGGSCYLLGREMAGPAGGAVAALLALSDASLIVTERRYFLDLPLASLIVASLWVLVRTERFTRSRWSLLLGVLMGLGMLTKQTYLWFVVSPVLAVAVAGLRAHARESEGGVPFARSAACLAVVVGLAAAFMGLGRWRRSLELWVEFQGVFASWTAFEPAAVWLVLLAIVAACLRWICAGPARNLTASVLLAGAVCGPWTLSDAHYLGERWKSFSGTLLENITQFPDHIRQFMGQAPIYLTVAAAIGVGAALFWRSRWKVSLPILLATLSGLGATTLFIPFSERYCAPINVCLAILAVAWVPRRWGIPWMFLLVMLPLVCTNLLGEQAVAREPRLLAAYNRFAEVTMGATANGIARDPGAREEQALAILDALPPRTRTLYLVDVEVDRDLFSDLQLLTNAWAHWRGQPLLVHLFQVVPDGLRMYRLEVRPEERERMLATWRGDDPDDYPTVRTSHRFQPQAVLLSARVSAPELSAFELFGAWYARVPCEAKGVVLLWRVGAPAGGVCLNTGGRSAPPSDVPEKGCAGDGGRWPEGAARERMSPRAVASARSRPGN